MRLDDIRTGMRVIAYDPSGLDTDSGVVLDTNPDAIAGHEVLVGWDQ